MKIVLIAVCVLFMAGSIPGGQEPVAQGQVDADSVVSEDIGDKTQGVAAMPFWFALIVRLRSP